MLIRVPAFFFKIDALEMTFQWLFCRKWRWPIETTTCAFPTNARWLVGYIFFAENSAARLLSLQRTPQCRIQRVWVGRWLRIPNKQKNTYNMHTLVNPIPRMKLCRQSKMNLWCYSKTQSRCLAGYPPSALGIFDNHPRQNHANRRVTKEPKIISFYV